MLKIITYIFAAIGVVSVVGIGVGCIFHHHHRGDMAERTAWMVKRVSNKLDLNEDQKTKLQAVADEVVKLRQEKFATHEQMLNKLTANILSDKLDKQLLLTSITESTDSIKQSAPAVIDKLADFHDSLTPEQRAKVVKFMTRMHARHGHSS